jgi:hypothetical protein
MNKTNIKASLFIQDKNERICTRSKLYRKLIQRTKTPHMSVDNLEVLFSTAGDIMQSPTPSLRSTIFEKWLLHRTSVGAY